MGGYVKLLTPLLFEQLLKLHLTNIMFNGFTAPCTVCISTNVIYDER